MKYYFILELIMKLLYLLFEHIQSKFIEPNLYIFYKFLNSENFFSDNLPIIINDKSILRWIKN